MVKALHDAGPPRQRRRVQEPLDEPQFTATLHGKTVEHCFGLQDGALFNRLVSVFS
jgi:hypothetical protein